MLTLAVCKQQSQEMEDDNIDSLEWPSESEIKWQNKQALAKVGADRNSSATPQPLYLPHCILYCRY